MSDSQLNELIDAAVDRIHSEMKETAPFMAQQVYAWLESLVEPAQPADYFKHPLGFPFLLAPYWLEKNLAENLNTEVEQSFQADLVYASINGFYYIRLIDNIMDGHSTVEQTLLPATGFFYSQFQATYYRHFAYAHPFWDFFHTTAMHQSEVTIMDTMLEDIDREQFEKIVSQKICGAKIPLAALCHKYQRPDLINPWSEFIDRFGCWYMFQEDLFDWHKDLTHQTTTYFLSEAKRRKDTDESVAAWVIRAGVSWGIATLQTWMKELKQLAANLQNEDVEIYLQHRETLLLRQQKDLNRALKSLAKLLELG